MKHEICKLTDIPETGSRIFPFFGRELHIYRANGRLRAVANICMHFGGPLECSGEQFVCQWHGARFDKRSGKRMDGPAPAGARLMFLPTRVEDDALFYVWGE